MIRTLTGFIVVAAVLAPALARADGDIVIELKGAPQPPAVQSESQSNESAAQAPGPSRQHVAVARRTGGDPLPLAPVPKERSYGQLGMTLAAENPIFRKPDVRSAVLSRPSAR